MRKNYTSYKDGYPVIDLTVAQLKAIDKNICIRVVLRENGKKEYVRLRKKPAKKLTLAQQNAQLRYQLRRMQTLLGTHQHKKEPVHVH